MIFTENGRCLIRKASKTDLMTDFTMIARTLHEKVELSKEDLEFCVNLAFKSNEEIDAEVDKAILELVKTLLGKDFGESK